MDGWCNNNAKRPSPVPGAVSQPSPPLPSHQAYAVIKPPHLCLNEYTPPPELPRKLRIWQQIVHRSKTAHSYIINTANPKDWDILALQEPWIDSFGNSQGSQYWRVVYPANFYDKDLARIHSILLVNTNLSTDCYIPLLIPHSNVTAIRFKGENSFMSLFNVYNEITNNDTLRALDTFCEHNDRLIHPTNNDGMLWIGNFNQHHPMWEDNSNERLFEPKEFIPPLINLLFKYDMLLSLPKGVPTLQTPAGNWTWPDNVWWSHTPEDPIQRCDTVPAIRPPLADHLPIVTILDLPLPRSASLPTLNSRMADWDKINKALSPRLDAESPAVHITSEEEFIKKGRWCGPNHLQSPSGPNKSKITQPLHAALVDRRLSILKRTHNRLSNKSHKFWHVHDHPSHTKYKAAANKFKDVMTETHNQDWICCEYTDIFPFSFIIYSLYYFSDIFWTLII